MPMVNMLDAKSSLSRLVESVASGGETEIIIARNGRPAARLVPLGKSAAPMRIGVARGQFLAPTFAAPDDIDSLHTEIAALFAGCGDA